MKKAIFFFFLLCSLSTKGQELSYKHIEYTVEDGLPSTGVYSSIEDQQGIMWFGTDAGVSKFNGYEFTNYTTLDGLADNEIFHLYEDIKGRIWFMAFNGSLSYMEDGVINKYKYNDKLIDAIKSKGHVTQLLVDTNDNIEFITKYGEFGSISSQGVVSSILVSGKENYNWSEKEKKGMKLLSSFLEKKAALEREPHLQNEEYRAYFSTDSLYPNKNHLSNHSDNGVSFLLGGVYYYVYDSLIISRRTNKNKLNIIINFHLDLQNQFWVHYHNGGIEVYKSINHFFDRKLPLYKMFDGLNVSAVLNKKNGETWICMENEGVFYLLNQHINNYTFGTNKQNNKIVSLCKNDLNEVFYASKKGNIYRIDTLGKHSLFSEGHDDVDNIYINDSQLHIALPSKNQRAHSPKGIAKERQHTAKGLEFSNNGSIWEVGYGGVRHFMDGVITYNSRDIKNYIYMKCIFEDKGNKIWVGGINGLSLFENDSLHNVKKWTGYYGPINVTDIDQLEDSTLVIATGGNGLFLLKSPLDKDNRLAINLGLMGPILRDIYIDEEETIWIASNNGLFAVKIDSSGSAIIEKYTHKNGLPTNEINATLAVGKTLYVATNKGLAEFERKNLNIAPKPPQIHIQSIRVNERSLKIDSSYKFKYRENYIQFSYIGISYRSLGAVEYRYKLEGIDKVWQYTKSREIRFPSLAPNKYTFLLSATNGDGIWSKEKKIQFTIHLPFWKEWWFIVLIGASLFSTLLILFKQHNKRKINTQIKNQEIELHKRKVIETELKALRAQMNPHFTFNTLNSIQNLIIQFDQDKALTYLSQFSLLLRKVLENSKSPLITIQEEFAMLALYIEMENLRFDETINYSVLIDDKIDSEFDTIPSMILQPIVENSIIHGLSNLKDRSKEIKITMQLEPNYILCSIEDNGIGRKRSEEVNRRKNFNKQSLGMQITRERLSLFFKDRNDGLSFQIFDLHDTDGKGIGTRVEIYFRH